MPARLNRQELEQIITNIENNGGDASALKALMENGPQTSNVPTDDELVGLKRSQSVVKEGEGLTCVICGTETKRLTADVCDGCFRDWVLSCKTKEKHQWKHK